MPGLVPGIHVLAIDQQNKDVDGRDEPGHDGGEVHAAIPHFSITTPASLITLAHFSISVPIKP